mmetsp:Transcript_9243/g.29762  ORF Transcript_9243/g.29762 Transcript_9243/m.29762 type:complete len:205 (-) Transcript_9243:777-1391(-)
MCEVVSLSWRQSDCVIDSNVFKAANPSSSSSFTSFSSLPKERANSIACANDFASISASSRFLFVLSCFDFVVDFFATVVSVDFFLRKYAEASATASSIFFGSSSSRFKSSNRSSSASSSLTLSSPSLSASPSLSRLLAIEIFFNRSSNASLSSFSAIIAAVVAFVATESSPFGLPRSTTSPCLFKSLAMSIFESESSSPTKVVA